MYSFIYGVLCLPRFIKTVKNKEWNWKPTKKNCFENITMINLLSINFFHYFQQRISKSGQLGKITILMLKITIKLYYWFCFENILFPILFTYVMYILQTAMSTHSLIQDRYGLSFFVLFFKNVYMFVHFTSVYMFNP